LATTASYSFLATERFLVSNLLWKDSCFAETSDEGDPPMMVHEFQAKELLSTYGLVSPGGKVAITGGEAENVAREFGLGSIVVKAQVHAGGRARAGGITVVNSPEQAKSAAEKMLGRRLVTDQTGPFGRVTKRVYIERAVQARRELMIAFLVDTSTGEFVVIGSEFGGDDIEERALRGELRLQRLPLRQDTEPFAGEITSFAAGLRLDGVTQDAFCRLILNLRRAFLQLDASLIEINPLIIDETGSLQAVDVKMSLDDNALFRHPEVAVLWDEDDFDDLELQSQHHQINYVALDGNIGIAANGAGLGLATLDMVRDAGGRPANFMDVRTTASSVNIAFGFGLLLKNPAIKVLLVNVHGGGMQPCDTIADGLGIAARRTGRSLPTAVRLAGNNAEFARFRFANFGYPIIECKDMWTAANKAVSMARGG
jgi:succinyl-CoA synthetase beta subunit